MEAWNFRFKLGEFVCVALYDGHFNYPADAFFSNAMKTELADTLSQKSLPLDRVTTPYACLLVDTGQHKLLVDTGAGNLELGAARMFPSVDHTTTVTGKLVRSLRSAGIEPTDIDVIIVTHAHPDHVGGTLDDDGNLVFGEAQYFLSEDEWAFWASDMPNARVSQAMINIARRNLQPLQDRLTLIDDSFEVTPGIRVMAAPGHTPGHLVVSIQSGGRHLLNISDTALHPLHLEYPEWYPVFDINPAQAIASKHQIFDWAAETGALVFAHHFPPFPNLGYIGKERTGWRWHPMDSLNG